MGRTLKFLFVILALSRVSSAFYPCNSSIVIALDASNNTGTGDNTFVYDLYEKNLVGNYLIQSNWTDINRIGLVAYANTQFTKTNFGQFNDVTSIKQAVTNLPKYDELGTIASGMSDILQGYPLYYNNLRYQNTIFFIASNDPTDIANAHYNASMLSAQGSLILVALEPYANAQSLLPLVNNDTSKIIKVNSTGTNLPFSDIAAKIVQQFRCELQSTADPSTTSIVTQQQATSGATQSQASTGANTATQQAAVSTTQPPAPPNTATTPPQAYEPCQMFINIIVDASNGLATQQFSDQLSFLAFDVFGINWNHFERLNYGSYADRLSYYGFVNGMDQLAIQKDVLNTKQSNVSAANSRTALHGLDNMVVNSTFKLSTIVFLSTVNPSLINNSVTFAQSLQNKGRLTIVALGSAANSTNIALLKTLTPNIIPWDMTKKEPENWQTLFWEAYGCGGAAPTGTPPVVTTTVTIPPSPTTAAPYRPCANTIIMLFDNSNSPNFTQGQYNAELIFLANNIFPSVAFNHLERLALASYDVQPDDTLTYGFFKSTNDVFNYILTDGRVGTASISAALGAAGNLATSTVAPVGSIHTILLASTADPSDVAQAAAAAQTLNGLGGLSILTLGNSTDFSPLTSLSSHILSWSDAAPSKSPAGYQEWFNVAYGCGNTTSATSTAGVPSSAPVSTQGLSTSGQNTATSAATSSVPGTTSLAPATTQGQSTAAQSTAAGTTAGATTVGATTAQVFPSSTVAQVQTSQPIATSTAAAATTTTPTTPVPTTAYRFPQCYSYIPVGIDISNDVDNATYDKQVQFIVNGLSQIYNPSVSSLFFGYGYGFPKVYFTTGRAADLVNFVTRNLVHTANPPPFLDLLRLMTNINALNGYSNPIPINTVLFLGSTPDSATLTQTAPMIQTLITYGNRNNTVIGLPLNPNVTPDTLKPWRDVGMKFLPWDDDNKSFTLTLEGLMNCQSENF